MPGSATIALIAMQELAQDQLKEGMVVLVKRPDGFSAQVTVFESAVFDVEQTPKALPNQRYFRVKKSRLPWLYQHRLHDKLVLTPVSRQRVAVLGTKCLYTELKITPKTTKEMD